MRLKCKHLVNNFAICHLNSFEREVTKLTSSIIEDLKMITSWKVELDEMTQQCIFDSFINLKVK